MVVKGALLILFLLPRVRRIGVDLGGHPSGDSGVGSVSPTAT
jgi:hypothetical protein